MTEHILLVNQSVAEQVVVMTGEIAILRQELDADDLEKDEYDRLHIQLDRACRALGNLIAGNLSRAESDRLTDVRSL